MDSKGGPKVVAVKRGIKRNIFSLVVPLCFVLIGFYGDGPPCETVGNTNQIMGYVPKELMATSPKLMEIDNQKVQDVHMWFGGYIEWEPKVRYVGEKKALFERKRTSETTFDKLVAMHNKVDPGSEVNFYFRHPDCSFDGQLLSAIGRDGNDNMYPIALAVVEAEMYDSWWSFLNELMTNVGIDNRVGWTFILDRQKGLTASSTNPQDFNRAMEELQKPDPKVGNTVNATGAIARMVDRGLAGTSSTFGTDIGSSATHVGSAQQGIGKPLASHPNYQQESA
ncbi:hypothetical protein ACH5RR_037315 [Cinchona calisaya]|uniref:Uncharacterized protein n=1 Tax=Cinchona calisaya TaxID=153742 RepID=A0ABD2Y5S7_9GENT